jgi:hypothetical protein
MGRALSKVQAKELRIEDYGGEGALIFTPEPNNGLSCRLTLESPNEWCELQDGESLVVWNISPEHADEIARFLDHWANG